MRLELRHLRVIVAIADAGSIRRAATLLHLAQPALTTQLHRIEEELGGALFTRTRDGVSATELGQYVLAHSQELLDGFDQLLAGARLSTQRASAGPVRVGGVSGLLSPLLVAAVRDLLPDRPVTSRMRRSTTPLLRLLADGDLDVAGLHEFVGFAVRPPAGVARRTLLTEPVFVTLSDSHRLADRSEVDLRDLAEEDWAMPETDDSGLHASFRLVCEAAGFTPRYTHWTCEAGAAMALVGTGTAVAGFYPTGAVPPGLVVRPLAGNPHHRRLLLAWRTPSPIADLAPELHRRVLDGYLAIMRRQPHYRAWWERGGAEFARTRSIPN